MVLNNLAISVFSEGDHDFMMLVIDSGVKNGSRNILESIGCKVYWMKSHSHS